MTPHMIKKTVLSIAEEFVEISKKRRCSECGNPKEFKDEKELIQDFSSWLRKYSSEPKSSVNSPVENIVNAKGFDFSYLKSMIRKIGKAGPCSIKPRLIGNKAKPPPLLDATHPVTGNASCAADIHPS